MRMKLDSQRASSKLPALTKVPRARIVRMVNGAIVSSGSGSFDATGELINMKKTICAVLIVAFVTSPLFAQQQVAFKSDDGFELKADFYTTSGRPGPGILMLHQCDADRKVYETLAQMLSTVGYHVLALDFRGFGESKGAGY